MVYVTVIFVGVCGNSVVVHAFMRHRRPHTSTNYFIICLVVSDIVLCTFSLPVQLHYQLTNSWVPASCCLNNNKFVRPRWPYDMRPSVRAEKYIRELAGP